METDNHVLRSICSSVKVYIRFVNRTPYIVNMYWVDYEGRDRIYKSLQTGCYIDIDTFETHPWFVLRSENKRLMDVGGKPIYMPVSPKDVPAEAPSSNRIFPIVPPSRRKVVPITIPVYTLKDCCSILIISILMSNGREVKKLNLPKTLIDELDSEMKIIKENKC